MSLGNSEFLKRVTASKSGVKPLVPYTNNRAKMKAKCVCGAVYYPTAEALMAGRKCTGCRATTNARNFLHTHDQYVADLKRIHGRNVKVVGSYVDLGTAIEHACLNGHTWIAAPASVKHGGCPHCAQNAKLTVRDIQSRITLPHIKCIEYTGAKSKSSFRCTKCKYEWQTVASIAVACKGCPNCEKVQSYSRSGVSVMEVLAKKLRLSIKHAQNGGEYLIPGTNFKVDGYNKRFNLVFEFYGDYWHGNPKVRASSSPANYYGTKTAKQAYDATILREKQLRALGYKVISIWEADWKKSPAHVVKTVKTKVERLIRV